jgi:hypothetical protein
VEQTRTKQKIFIIDLSTFSAFSLLASSFTHSIVYNKKREASFMSRFKKKSGFKMGLCISLKGETTKKKKESLVTHTDCFSPYYCCFNQSRLEQQ